MCQAFLDRDEWQLDEATATLSDLKVLRGAARVPGLVIERVVVKAKSKHFRFADPLHDLSASVFASGGKVNRSTTIDALLRVGAGLTVASDGATFACEMSGTSDRHVVRGHASVNASGIGLASKKFYVRANLLAKVNVVDFDLRRKTARVFRSSAIATRIEGGADRGGVPDVFGDRPEFRASSPSFDFAHPNLKNVDLRIIIDRARMSDARALNRLFPQGPFVVESGVAQLSGDIELASSKRVGRGGVQLTLTGASFALHETKVTGDYTLIGQVRDFDSETSRVDISH